MYAVCEIQHVNLHKTNGLLDETETVANLIAITARETFYESDRCLSVFAAVQDWILFQVSQPSTQSRIITIYSL